VLAGFTVVAAFMFHLDAGDQMQTIMFMKNLAIAGGLLLLFSHGAGEFSLDARSNRTVR
jgi:putative oxidoreductase